MYSSCLLLPSQYFLHFLQRVMSALSVCLFVCLFVCVQYIVLSQLDAPDAADDVNPMVLMREPGGWWGFHSGKNMTEFINSFSTSLAWESVLRENIVEAVHYTKKLLLSKVTNRWLTK